MEKSSPAINKINFILFINLLALIVIVNVSAISFNNELNSLDASLDNLTDKMRSYNESYPTVHLVEFSDFNNIGNPKIHTEVAPFANNTSQKSSTKTMIEKNHSQHQPAKDVPMTEKNMKGFMIDQVAFFIVATPVIAFFLLVNNSVGVGINKLIKLLN